MTTRQTAANTPRQRPDEPLGDRGQGDKTWTPDAGEQGISNRADDEDPDAFEDDADDEEFDEDESSPQ
jgi:hypothetical protein